VDTLACRIIICLNRRRISATCRFPKLQLFDSVRIGIRIKGYSIRTEKSYVSWIKRFILFHDKRHPNEMGKVEIEAISLQKLNRHRASRPLQNAPFCPIHVSGSSLSLKVSITFCPASSLGDVEDRQLRLCVQSYA